MYEFLCGLIAQGDYIMAGILFVGMIGTLLLVANISIIIMNRIVLFFRSKNHS